MIRQPPTSPSAEQRNGRPPEAPPGPPAVDRNLASAVPRQVRLGQAGYWVRWTLGVVALVALLNGLAALVLFVASQVPASLLVFALGLATVLGLFAVVVSPPLYAPPTTARLTAEDWLRNHS